MPLPTQLRTAEFGDGVFEKLIRLLPASCDLSIANSFTSSITAVLLSVAEQRLVLEK